MKRLSVGLRVGAGEPVGESCVDQVYRIRCVGGDQGMRAEAVLEDCLQSDGRRWTQGQAAGGLREALFENAT